MNTIQNTTKGYNDYLVYTSDHIYNPIPQKFRKLDNERYCQVINISNNFNIQKKSANYFHNPKNSAFRKTLFHVKDNTNKKFAKENEAENFSKANENQSEMNIEEENTIKSNNDDDNDTLNNRIIIKHSLEIINGNKSKLRHDNVNDDHDDGHDEGQGQSQQRQRQQDIQINIYSNPKSVINNDSTTTQEKHHHNPYHLTYPPYLDSLLALEALYHHESDYPHHTNPQTPHDLNNSKITALKDQYTHETFIHTNPKILSLPLPLPLSSKSSMQSSTSSTTSTTTNTSNTTTNTTSTHETITMSISPSNLSALSNPLASSNPLTPNNLLPSTNPLVPSNSLTSSNLLTPSNPPASNTPLTSNNPSALNNHLTSSNPLTPSNSSASNNPLTSSNPLDLQKTRKCNCKQSKCLKLYCECLAFAEYCDETCGCIGCHNTHKDSVLRDYALSLIIERKEDTGIKRNNNNKFIRGKGCTCKKSACMKKYCECFNSGTGCGPDCRCENCKNVYNNNQNGIPEGLILEDDERKYNIGSELMSKIALDSSKIAMDSSKTTMDSSKTLMGSSKITMDSSKILMHSSKTPMYSSKTTMDSSKTLMHSSRTSTDSSKTSIDSSKTSMDSSKSSIDSSKFSTDSNKSSSDPSKASTDSSKTELTTNQKKNDISIMETLIKIITMKSDNPNPNSINQTDKNLSFLPFGQNRPTISENFSFSDFNKLLRKITANIQPNEQKLEQEEEEEQENRINDDETTNENSPEIKGVKNVLEERTLNNNYEENKENHFSIINEQYYNKDRVVNELDHPKSKVLIGFPKYYNTKGDRIKVEEKENCTYGHN